MKKQLSKHRGLKVVEGPMKKLHPIFSVLLSLVILLAGCESKKGTTVNSVLVTMCKW
jgi:hypothetical protein